MNLEIQVFNDGKKVFEGDLDIFLKDNEYDEWLVDICNSLITMDYIQFSDYHSGDWKIEKK